MPFRNSKSLKIELGDYGSYLGRDVGCFELKTKDGCVEHFPHFEKEIGECVLKSGSYVSVDALIDLMIWNIDTYIMTRHNRVVGFLKNVEDDAHVKTRVAQYQALENGKGLKIAKEIVKAKIEGQNMVLRKYDLKAIDRNVEDVTRRKLLSIESQHARHYFKQIFKLFPEHLRPEKRTGFKAYDGINNTFNLGYRILSNKVMVALLKAKLEPYLGFYHTIKFGQASLVCDFMDLYRYVIDHFLITYCRKLNENDFEWKDDLHAGIKGKRAFLNHEKNVEFLNLLENYFETKVNVPRMKHGNRQELESAINEEAMLMASFIRGTRIWEPRTVPLPNFVMPRMFGVERKSQHAFHPFFPKIDLKSFNF